MTIRKLVRRNLFLIVVAVSLFLWILWVLYSAQIIYGQEYSEQSERKQVSWEVVEVARGEILDRYGRLLVSNEVVYHVELSAISDETERNETVEWLLTLAQEQELSWNTSLHISDTAPYEYTVENVLYGTYQDDNGEDYRVLTRLGNFCLKLGWIEDPRDQDIPTPTASTVIKLMAKEFGLTDYSEQEQRDMASVIYDLYLREMEIRYDAYYFLEDIDILVTSKIKEKSPTHVDIVSATQRVLHTDYAAHLLGRVSSMSTAEWEHYKTLDLGYEMDDKVGKEGVELAFESYLRGEEGLRITESNGQGDVMSAYWEKEPIPGENVVLTLDIDLQKKVEDVLSEQIPQMQNTNIQGGACVIVEVNTGAVLAAGSYPTFDLKLYSEQIQENLNNPLNPLFNRAFQGLYAPGSTFKMLTGLAALEEGIVTPTTRIYDDGPFTYYQDYSPACWIYNQFRGSHGWQNISDALKNSCNYYFYEVGLQLGIGRIVEYAEMFGLGEATGIELQERVGVMAGPEYTESLGNIWYEGATLSVAIGQESSAFSPLQLSNYLGTLVNGGVHYQAHLLQEVKTGDYSQISYSYDPEINGSDLGFSQTNLNAVKQGMGDMVSSGSVSNDFATLRAMGIQVGGKTGTAQITNESSASANAVFVCFAPYDNPEIAMTIIVEKGGSGNEVAAAAAEILEYYFTNKENRDEIPKENTLLP